MPTAARDQLVQDVLNTTTYEEFAPLYAELDREGVASLYHEISHHARFTEVTEMVARFLREHPHHPNFLGKTTPFSHLSGTVMEDTEDGSGFNPVPPKQPVPAQKGWVAAG